MKKYFHSIFQQDDEKLVPIGTETPHGKVAGIRHDGHERTYICQDGSDIALIPADILEKEINK